MTRALVAAALTGAAITAAAPAAADDGPDLANESHLQPDAVAVGRYLTARYPELHRIGGWRARDSYPDHPSGRALDVMIPGWDTPDGIALGDRIRDDLLDHAPQLGVQYVIWRQTYYPVGGAPRRMANRGSANENHYTHVHVTVVGRAGTGIDP